MRTLAGQEAQVEALTERTTHLRVQIDRTGAGAFVDLSDFEGRDWIDSVEYEDNGDGQVAVATVRLVRQWHDLNLSPLMAQSKLNTGGVLVFPKRVIKIETQVVPRGEPAGPWLATHEVFNGKIDRINWQKSPMELKCRGKGGTLQDSWVITQKVYGTGGGRNIEDVIQDVLDDAFTDGSLPAAVTLFSITGTGGTPFQPADSPGFFVLEYKQGREPVMDAVQKLARWIGFECRYRWNTDTEAFQLVLYEPASPIRTRGTITIAGDPVNNETFVVDDTTYTAKTSGAGTDEFNIVAGDNPAMAANIAAMLDAGSGLEEINAWVSGSTVIVEWQVEGVAGNSVVFTEAMTNVTMDGSGTLGGTTAGVEVVSLHTFAPDQYHDVSQISIDVVDVRNYFSGTFEDTNKDRISVIRRNNESIDKYDMRPFLLIEEASKGIDTLTEMFDMLGAADISLSEPDELQSVEVQYFPWGEAGDAYTFEANGIHYDSDQVLAAPILRHFVSNSRTRTVLVTRGKPSLGPNRWLEAEGRPGVGAPSDIFSDNAAENVVATAGLGTVIINYDDPRTMDPAIRDWVVTRCHLSTSGGFTPGPSTLVDTAQKTHFEINGLIPGTTYFAKLQIIDSVGNVAATSSQVTVATERVGPFHENIDGQQDQILRNNDFNIFTKGQALPPDFWFEGTSTVWDTDVSVDDTKGETGSNVIEMFHTSSKDPELFSEWMPWQTGDLIQAGVFARSTTAGTDPQLRITVEYGTAAKASNGTATTDFDLTTTFAQFQTAVDDAPANTRFVRFVFSARSGASETYTAQIDRCSLLRSYAKASLVDSDLMAHTTSLAVITWADARIKADDIGFLHTGGTPNTGLTVVFPGVYLLAFRYRGEDVSAPVAFETSVHVDIDQGAGFVNYTTMKLFSRLDTGGGTELAETQIAPASILLLSGDKIRFRHVEDAATAGSTAAFLEFSVQQISRLDQ